MESEISVWNGRKYSLRVIAKLQNELVLRDEIIDSSR